MAAQIARGHDRDEPPQLVIERKLDRADLADLTGVNATSVYLSSPNGVDVDQSLGELTVGVVERHNLLDGIETLLEQQTQFLQVMMAVGLPVPPTCVVTSFTMVAPCGMFLPCCNVDK